MRKLHLLPFTPEIHFTYMFFDYVKQQKWKIEELYIHLEDLREKAKLTGYSWDNTNFRIDNIYGMPVIKLQLLKPSETRYCFGFWDINGNALFNLDYIPEPEVMKVAIDNITEGLRLCNDCAIWVKTGKNYSYAEFVCDKCYIPDKHLPPDTRGD